MEAGGAVAQIAVAHVTISGGDGAADGTEACHTLSARAVARCGFHATGTAALLGYSPVQEEGFLAVWQAGCADVAFRRFSNIACSQRYKQNDDD